MNGFIIQAIAEKVAALRARGLLRDLGTEEQAAYLNVRAARGRADRMTDILARAGTTNAMLPGDDLPKGWLAPATTPHEDHERS